VTLVTNGSRARLAASELQIRGLDAEQAIFNALWRSDAEIRPIEGVTRALAFNAGPDVAGELWLSNAARMFPGASIERRPERPDRLVVSRLVHEIGGQAALAARRNPRGPVVIHAGAGSEEKRWPLARFGDLIERLKLSFPVVLIAGEVEAERFGDCEQALFERLAGRFLHSLEDLAGVGRSARLFIAGDSGPAHLAAQLGVPTLTLFGPTLPELWGPVGPLVRTLAPAAPAPIAWIHPAPAFDAAVEFLHEVES
jgi:hypothetical protein